jgi:hypothetical protein
MGDEVASIVNTSQQLAPEPMLPGVSREEAKADLGQDDADHRDPRSPDAEHGELRQGRVPVDEL